MAYEIDGTAIYYKSTTLNQQYDMGVATKLTNDQMAELNDEDITVALSGWSDNEANKAAYMNLWMFFPEKRTIAAMHVSGFGHEGFLLDGNFVWETLQGSNDTTNGEDGTWETAVFPDGTPAVFKPMTSSWRTSIKAVSFSTPYRAIRALLSSGVGGGYYTRVRMAALHLYGTKAAEEQPDDLVFCETNGTEMTALNEFGDRAEASTVTDSFKIKNISTTKTATTVNVAITHTDFLLSLSETGPWTASLDIASIAANALSDTIYIKNELGQPPLTLGPKAARVVTTIGSWV